MGWEVGFPRKATIKAARVEAATAGSAKRASDPRLAARQARRYTPAFK
jgi:hypothetical protein